MEKKITELEKQINRKNNTITDINPNSVVLSENLDISSNIPIILTGFLIIKTLTYNNFNLNLIVERFFRLGVYKNYFSD